MWDGVVGHVAQPVTIAFPWAAAQPCEAVGVRVSKDLCVPGAMLRPEKWALCFVVRGFGDGLEARDKSQGVVGKTS